MEPGPQMAHEGAGHKPFPSCKAPSKAKLQREQPEGGARPPCQRACLFSCMNCFPMLVHEFIRSAAPNRSQTGRYSTRMTTHKKLGWLFQLEIAFSKAQAAPFSMASMLSGAMAAVGQAGFLRGCYLVFF